MSDPKNELQLQSEAVAQEKWQKTVLKATKHLKTHDFKEASYHSDGFLKAANDLRS